MSRFGFWHGGGKPTIEFLGYLNQNNGSGNFSSKTFTGVNFGAESGDREIFLSMCIGNSAYTQRTISSITVGGYSPSAIGTSPSSASSTNTQTNIAIFHAPLGTSGNIPVSFSGNIASLLIGVYRVTGRSVVGATHVDHAATISAALVSSSTLNGIDIPNGGFALTTITPRDPASGCSITGSGFLVDASVNAQSSGGAIERGIGHCPVLDSAVSSGSATWSWSGSSYAVASAWVFN